MDKNINEAQKQCTIHGVSCRLLFIENSKTINGYSQMNSMPRALGFEDTYEIQNKIYKYYNYFGLFIIIILCPDSVCYIQGTNFLGLFFILLKNIFIFQLSFFKDNRLRF